MAKRLATTEPDLSTEDKMLKTTNYFDVLYGQDWRFLILEGKVERQGLNDGIKSYATFGYEGEEVVFMQLHHKCLD